MKVLIYDREPRGVAGLTLELERKRNEVVLTQAYEALRPEFYRFRPHVLVVEPSADIHTMDIEHTAKFKYFLKNARNLCSAKVMLFTTQDIQWILQAGLLPGVHYDFHRTKPYNSIHLADQIEMMI